ncbi:hypothetical protein B9Q04_15015 [Candidatus Marsarchaeota G2 archaeon BE_D]|uniref:Uncharacterized protein n=4 Tax=Candidatus Marsarchaeota group 2 TaxID=2203771 RepID=A0A2R6C723_9ARCH|nr:MAG: hypothetical protein B9Q06_05535 [Candidatus Marsarchaeota G2 archaeon ECH_B_2]PSN99678.1 MAG: hypothetical protein B9Q07_06215 [Candidatus Marsarchaeota G2 archaeon ECH_B_3]PSO02299.1 MAG: hypothetical protein B9Q05_05425 [Candidatus Marsarchaeota G2 archaeon ECH_B_1]PSO06638.1 MAG: hypothetical protein B9Q04_15015 [Candidatus Marsarchaeota G2 archaeon BE_D]
MERFFGYLKDRTRVFLNNPKRTFSTPLVDYSCTGTQSGGDSHECLSGQVLRPEPPELVAEHTSLVTIEFLIRIGLPLLSNIYRVCCF